MSVPEQITLNQIAVKIGSLEATQAAQAHATARMADSIDRLIEKLDESDDVAKEALHRVKAAQHQIDEMKDEHDTFKKTHGDDMKDIRSGQRWLIGTTISVVALFLTAIGILLRG